MKPEDLLKPRYKVIASYPECEFKIGTIIQMERFGKLPMQMIDEPIESWLTNFIDKPGTGGAMYSDVMFKPYPHLFRPLSWWEDRSPEDMPWYVKCVRTPDQRIMPGDVLKVKWKTVPGWGIAENNEAVIADTNCYLPATEEEYKAFITTK